MLRRKRGAGLFKGMSGRVRGIKFLVLYLHFFDCFNTQRSTKTNSKHLDRSIEARKKY